MTNREINCAFSGYNQAGAPAEDERLTHVGPGTPGGEYLRRYWHPIAMSKELKDLPLPIRILDEDLVLFRNRRGEIGVLHRHCPHRGASLEFAAIEDRGLRCCYHGWLIAMDGKVLEAPAEPPSSKIVDGLYHGAYPTFEFRDLIFCYMGPPETRPPFPILDTVGLPTQQLVPFSFHMPCNWIQIGDNAVDPVHTSFLHMIGFPQFGSDWAEMPEFGYRETPVGMIYVVTLRSGEYIRIRSNDAIIPNITQTAGMAPPTNEATTFYRTSLMTRWKVPVSNTQTLQIGWRHFDSDRPASAEDEINIGKEKLDVIGQTLDRRTYEERQRIPSDYDVMVSQRPIAIHELEHLASTDRGVAMLRRLIRRGINGTDPDRALSATGHSIPTYAHETLLHLPRRADIDDRAFLHRIGQSVTDIVVESASSERERRDSHICRKLVELQAREMSSYGADK